MFRIVWLIISFALLSACGLMPQKNYLYTPSANTDQKCVAHCISGKNNCQKICRLKNPACFLRADREIEKKYAAYRLNKMQRGEKVTKTSRDFAQSNPCYNACPCTISYNTCYTACGGTVTEKK